MRSGRSTSSTRSGVYLHTRDGRQDARPVRRPRGRGARLFASATARGARRARRRSLIFQSNAVPLEVRARAALRLTRFAGLGLNTAFFINTGAEANENALKLALRDHRPAQGRGRRRQLPRPHGRCRRRDLGRGAEVVRLSAGTVRRRVRAARRPRRDRAHRRHGHGRGHRRAGAGRRRRARPRRSRSSRHCASAAAKPARC